MNQRGVTYLEKKVAGQVKSSFPLSSLTTLGVGGIAEVCVWPSCVRDLVTLSSLKEECPVRIIGGGSNLIIHDGIIGGVVVCTKYLSSFSVIRETDKALITVEAGVPLAQLVNFGLKYGFAGLEFAVGIPGTLGGALIGNAGAQGEAISDLLQWVEVVDEHHQIRRLDKNDISWGYRYSQFKELHYTIASCCLIMEAVPLTIIRARTDEFLKMRSAQPHGYKSAGCIFKNPEGTSAGKLLDQCGCKGLKVGGAVVSEAHANFILNTGDATATDVLALIEKCRKIAFEETGYLLELEVQLFSSLE